jgi:hypothetical protein
MDISNLYVIDKITHFFAATITFDKRLHLCPRSLEQGKEVLSLPKFVTDKKPIEVIQDGKVNKFDFDTNSWVIVDKPYASFLTISVTKKVCEEIFTLRAHQENLGEFSCDRENWATDDTKIFRFEMDASPENINKINTFVGNRSYENDMDALARHQRKIKYKEYSYILERYEEQRTLFSHGLIAEERFKDTESNYLKYLVYKQKLRDLPSTWDPTNVVWPLVDFDF